MLADLRMRRLLDRMATRAGIDHRYSVLAPDPDPQRLDLDGRFLRGAFPGTAARMALYEHHAPTLAADTVAALDITPADRPNTGRASWRARVCQHVSISAGRGLFKKKND